MKRSQSIQDRASKLWWKLTERYDGENGLVQKSRIMELRARASYLFTANDIDPELRQIGIRQFHNEISSAGMICGRETSRIYGIPLKTQQNLATETTIRLKGWDI